VKSLVAAALSLAVVVDVPRARAESIYPSHAQITERLGLLAAQRPDLARIESFGPGLQQHSLTLTRRLSGEARTQQPALLVVSGLEPNDLAGPVAVVTAAETLAAQSLTNEATRRVLESVSVIFLPLAIPGESPWLRRPRDERSTLNTPAVDEDHDGRLDEDGPEDLNGDGLITSMRVEDPAGEFILDPTDDRLLIKADRTRGEVGAWRLLEEGRDSDGDEAWNEDGPGGVNPNRNFPANFRFFATDAGTHPMSEAATRALADLVIALPNIAAVLTLGAADNLSQAPKGEPGGKRPATTVHETDLPWITELGKAWRKALGLEKESPGSSPPGTFSDWVYFHRGRLSLAARPWFPALAADFTRSLAATNTNSPGTNTAQATNATTTTNATTSSVSGPVKSEAATTNAVSAPTPESPKKPDAKPEPEKRNEEDRAYLRWLDTNAPSGFVRWQRVDHPDFPGRRVEVGGFAPWSKTNPPESLVESLARRQAAFVVDLAGKLPRIGIRRTEAKARGKGVFEIRAEVENLGWLPTVLAHGETTREVNPTRVTLGLEDSKILSGTRTQRLGPIPGSGGMREVRWVVLAGDTRELEIEVVTTLAGRAKTRVSLPEEVQ
jgi:hypothetical protein